MSAEQVQAASGSFSFESFYKPQQYPNTFYSVPYSLNDYSNYQPAVQAYDRLEGDQPPSPQGSPKEAVRRRREKNAGKEI